MTVSVHASAEGKHVAANARMVLRRNAGAAAQCWLQLTQGKGRVGSSAVAAGAHLRDVVILLGHGDGGTHRRPEANSDVGLERSRTQQHGNGWRHHRRTPRRTSQEESVMAVRFGWRRGSSYLHPLTIASSAMRRSRIIGCACWPHMEGRKTHAGLRTLTGPTLQ